jgi:hypothetical protein
VVPALLFFFLKESSDSAKKNQTQQVEQKMPTPDITACNNVFPLSTFLPVTTFFVIELSNITGITGR